MMWWPAVCWLVEPLLVAGQVDTGGQRLQCPPRAQWSGAVAKEGARYDKAWMLQKILITFPGLKSVVWRRGCLVQDNGWWRQGCGWSWHWPSFGQTAFYQNWIGPWCSHCHLKDGILSINYSNFIPFQKWNLVFYVIYSHIVWKKNSEYWLPVENVLNQVM